MKRFLFFYFILLCTTVILNAQVPTPMSTSATWTKKGEENFSIKDNRGNILTNLKTLLYLKTDTLTVLDKDSRTIYMLANFKNAASGGSGKALVLSTNVQKDFYITNKFSFSFYINDTYQKGKYTNVQGSYIYYIEDKNATYFLEGIRKFRHWGAKSVKKMVTAPENTYWYRDVEKKSYGIVKEGKTIDYKQASVSQDGNDLVVKINGINTYILENYYNTGSYIIKAVKKHPGAIASNSGSGTCVSGNCNNGWGKYEYANGYYEGFWINGLKNGYGLYQWEGKGRYIGDWENDTMSGYGAYIADNKDNVIGEYKNGQLNGFGLTYIDGKWKQGIYTNGDMTTPYTFYNTEKELGCTAGDCQNKYGRMKWSNGDSFTGFFKNGNMYMGTYTFASGDKYSGMFNSKNQFHGMGRFFFKSGGYYGGNWQNGKYEGKGYYHNSEYARQVGIWSDGELVKNMQ